VPLRRRRTPTAADPAAANGNGNGRAGPVDYDAMAERKILARQAWLADRAAKQRAGQAAERERREAAQSKAAEQADAEHRARLADRFGETGAQRVVLHREYHLFLVPHRDVAVAYPRPAAPRHPGGHAPRATVAASPSSWAHQRTLQNTLNAGVDMPALVRGDRLLEAAAVVSRLLIDPTTAELEAVR
jgi:hypothetical protein